MIRNALPTDAEAVAALHHRARSTYYPDGLPDDGIDWPGRWREVIARPDTVVLCAVPEAGQAPAQDGPEVAGIASFRTAEGAGEETVKLYQFHVEPARWRAGIGTALHAACVAGWQRQGRRFAVLDVHVDNARARAFYAHHGWTPDPAFPPAEGDHHLALRLEVPLLGG
ncbi:GNAT family N-acetyltransferase [Streptomyces sp. NA04227]|uniref:GNAT family N-acetyltransferase n=1 Tax=Streptomyces sp. NA04227 TaxID=2742136 RepID=UPI0015926F18|nr:GNAT family N-acetyltransferase [Streptomyces sp. NA04227]QKW05808.1 GNAT family N-acetyltransferase [Streptomyces sp. NA04227]